MEIQCSTDRIIIFSGMTSLALQLSLIFLNKILILTIKAEQYSKYLDFKSSYSVCNYQFDTLQILQKSWKKTVIEGKGHCKSNVSKVALPSKRN